MTYPQANADKRSGVSPWGAAVAQATVALNIRPIDLRRDAETIIGYARDLFAISFGSHRFSDQFGAEGSGYIPWIADKQKDDPANAALAFLGAHPVGMVVVGSWADDPAIGYVYHYYLEPHARGHGLAPALDSHAASQLLRRGHGKARLSVAKTNARAIRFYCKRGWRHAGPRPDQPGIIYMEKPLGR